MTRLKRLRARAVKLGAMGNYRDAMKDLAVWPDLEKQILDDLERALDAHASEQAKLKGE